MTKIIDGEFVGWSYRNGPTFWYNPSSEIESHSAWILAREWGQYRAAWKRPDSWPAYRLAMLVYVDKSVESREKVERTV